MAGRYDGVMRFNTFNMSVSGIAMTAFALSVGLVCHAQVGGGVSSDSGVQESADPAQQGGTIAEPGVLGSASVEAALTAGAEQDKDVLVVFEASWSPPCKRMHAGTWADERLKAALAEGYVAVVRQTDGEGAADGSTYRVRVVPTLMVFRDGQPYDKISGYQSADEVLAWLEELEAGKRRSPELLGEERAAEALRPVVTPAQQGPFNAPGPGNQRGNFFHPEASELLEKLRTASRDAQGRLLDVQPIEALEALVDRDGSAGQWLASQRDSMRTDEAQRWVWVTLNATLDEDALTMQWLDGLDTAQRGALAIGVKDRLIDVLAKRGRYAQLASLYPVEGEAWAELQGCHAGLMQDPALIALPMGEAMSGRTQRVMRWNARAGVVYAALLSAERESEASGLLDAARSVSGAGASLVLIESALDAGQSRPEHTAVLSSYAGTPMAGRAEALRSRGVLIALEAKVASGDADALTLRAYLEARASAGTTPAGQRQLRASRVQDKIDAAFEQARAQPDPQGGDTAGSESLEAAMAWRSGRHGVARQKIESLGERFDPQAWQRDGAGDGTLARSEVYARTGPVADVLSAADRYETRGNRDAAARQYRSAMSVLKPNDPGRPFVQHRIDTLLQADTPADAD